jgi:hypothetical protein
MFRIPFPLNLSNLGADTVVYNEHSFYIIREVNVAKDPEKY